MRTKSPVLQCMQWTDGDRTASPPHTASPPSHFVAFASRSISLSFTFVADGFKKCLKNDLINRSWS